MISMWVSIHALLAECDIYPTGEVETIKVSIHALLAECDSRAGDNPRTTKVSIHALLAECDILPNGEIATLVKFQSTHSLRSATKL